MTKTSGAQPLLKTPSKRAEQIAQLLRRRIVRGELRAGEHLPPESELLAQLEVSRPTLRAALRILESESLIHIVNGSPKGPRILMPSPLVAARHVGRILQSRHVALADVYAMRLLVEPMAARILAAYSHPLTISALNAAIADEQRCLDDDARFGASEVRFHETLFEHTGNQTLMLMFELLHAIFEQHMKAFNAAYEPHSDVQVQRKKTLAAQKKLVALIKAGDAQAAESFWATYLNVATKVLLRDPRMERVVDLTG